MPSTRTTTRSKGASPEFRLADPPPAAEPGVQVPTTAPAPATKSGAAASPEAELAALLGTTDPDVLRRISSDLVALSEGKPGAGEVVLKGLMADMRALAPKNMMEAMLAIQMAAVHAATVRHAAVLERAKTALEISLAQNGLIKLARTFTAQVDALSRLRDGGTRTMRIERVSISEGGRAIIGNMVGGEAEK